MLSTAAILEIGDPVSIRNFFRFHFSSLLSSKFCFCRWVYLSSQSGICLIRIGRIFLQSLLSRRRLNSVFSVCYSLFVCMPLPNASSSHSCCIIYLMLGISVLGSSFVRSRNYTVYRLLFYFSVLCRIFPFFVEFLISFSWFAIRPSGIVFFQFFLLLVFCLFISIVFSSSTFFFFHWFISEFRVCDCGHRIWGE